MVFRFKGSRKFRAYIGVLIIVIITLTGLLCFGTFLGMLSSNITEVRENPILEQLRIDSENNTKCTADFWSETILYSSVKSLEQDNDPENYNIIKGICDIPGKITETYYYFETDNRTTYGVGETSKYQGAIWVRYPDEYIMVNITDEAEYTFEMRVDKWRFLAYQRSVDIASWDLIIENSLKSDTSEFLAIIWIILMGDIAFAIFFGLLVALINPYGRLGVSINVFIFKRLNGRIGKFLNKIRLLDFQETDQWYVERHLIYDLKFNSSRTMSRELLVSRWRDFWFMPAAIVVFFMTTFEKPLQSLVLSITGDKTYEIQHFLLILIFLSIFVAVILNLFYPSIWIFTDIGLKKYRTSSTGDIESVESLGTTLRHRLEILFGFTTILSLSSLASQIVGPKGLQDSVPTSGSILTFVEFFVSFTSILAFFLLIICFVVPIIICVGLVHFNKNHVRVMTETRKQLVTKCNALIGTIQPNIGYAAEDEAISVYYDEKEETIHYKGENQTL